MWYYWVILAIVAIVVIVIVSFLSVRLKAYRQRYKNCVADVLEAISDITKATNMVMYGYDPARIDAVILETILGNFIIQRTFAEYGVLYIREVRPKWIQRQMKKVKED